MIKYKLGDKVKIISGRGNTKFYIGYIGTVKKVSPYNTNNNYDILCIDGTDYSDAVYAKDCELVKDEPVYFLKNKKYMKEYIEMYTYAEAIEQAKLRGCDIIICKRDTLVERITPPTEYKVTRY